MQFSCASLLFSIICKKIWKIIFFRWHTENVSDTLTHPPKTYSTGPTCAKWLTCARFHSQGARIRAVWHVKLTDRVQILYSKKVFCFQWVAIISAKTLQFTEKILHGASNGATHKSFTFSHLRFAMVWRRDCTLLGRTSAAWKTRQRQVTWQRRITWRHTRRDDRKGNPSWW